MGKKVTLAAVIVAALVAFVSGFLAGRKFPPHNYVVASLEGKNIVLLDTATGKICSPTRNIVEQRVTENTLRSPDAADPAKLADELQKISEGMDTALGPRCPE
jgi:hypothetical protein